MPRLRDVDVQVDRLQPLGIEARAARRVLRTNDTAVVADSCMTSSCCR